MSELNQLQNLLNEVSAISKKYEKLAEITGQNFNVFKILGLTTDEVRTHSAFLAELLNPKGSHGQGTTFLELFVEQLKQGGDTENIENFEVIDAKVFVEKSIGEKTETDGGRIDIIIESGKNAIIIENKIYAGDQENQLLRYANYAKKLENSWLFYLTLDGHEASTFSTGYGEIKYYPISYKDDIKPWLESCREKAATQPILRETITQYINLINNLTGQTMNTKENDEIFESLSQNGNILAANKIIQSWDYIKIIVELIFWENLENKVKEENMGKILGVQKYSEFLIKEVLRKKINRNPWYGIMIELFTIDNAHNDYPEVYPFNTFCLYLERGTENLHLGITLIDKKKYNDNKIDECRMKDMVKLQDIKEKIKEICPKNNYNEWWLGKKELSRNINFELFSNDDTLLLINEKKRESYIDEIIGEMKDCITKIRTVFYQK